MFTYIKEKIKSFILGKGYKCEICKDGAIYPYYGLIPHVHIQMHDGSVYTHFLRPPPTDTFLRDIENRNAGIYFCPQDECKAGNNKKQRIRGI